MTYNQPKTDQKHNQPAKPVLPANAKPTTANDDAPAKVKPADATKVPAAKTGAA